MLLHYAKQFIPSYPIESNWTCKSRVGIWYLARTTKYYACCYEFRNSFSLVAKKIKLWLLWHKLPQTSVSDDHSGSIACMPCHLHVIPYGNGDLLTEQTYVSCNIMACSCEQKCAGPNECKSDIGTCQCHSVARQQKVSQQDTSQVKIVLWYKLRVSFFFTISLLPQALKAKVGLIACHASKWPWGWVPHPCCLVGATTGRSSTSVAFFTAPVAVALSSSTTSSLQALSGSSATASSRCSCSAISFARTDVACAGAGTNTLRLAGTTCACTGVVPSSSPSRTTCNIQSRPGW